MTTSSWGFLLLGIAIGIVGVAAAYWVTDISKILPMAAGLALLGAVLIRRQPVAS